MCPKGMRFSKKTKNKKPQKGVFCKKKKTKKVLDAHGAETAMAAEAQQGPKQTASKFLGGTL